MQPIEIIVEIMNEKKLKYNDFADYIGVSKAVVSSWKQRKKNPPLELAIKICEFLDISIYTLLGQDEKNLSENEIEILRNFNKLPEREQIKWIGRLEEIAEKYQRGNLEESNEIQKIS